MDKITSCDKLPKLNLVRRSYALMFQMGIKPNILQLQRFQRYETFLRSLKYIFCISKIKYRNQYVIKPFNFLPSLRVN